MMFFLIFELMTSIYILKTTKNIYDIQIRNTYIYIEDRYINYKQICSEEFTKKRVKEEIHIYI